MRPATPPPRAATRTPSRAGWRKPRRSASPKTSPIACVPPPPSLFSKGCTPTAASAATKSAASPPKTNPSPANRATASAIARKAKRARESVPTSAAAITEAPMKWFNYSRYTGEDFGIDADDLLQALADFLLQSGFQDPYMPGGEWEEHTLENLKQAILRSEERRVGKEGRSRWSAYHFSYT